MIALVAVGLLLLAAPGWCSARRRGSANDWVRMSRILLATGSVAVVAGLGLWTVPLALHSLDGLGLDRLCDAAAHRLSLGGVRWAVGAGIACGALLFRSSTAWRDAGVRRRAARIDASIGEHRRHGDFDLVVVPSAGLVATGVPGRQPQIVVSNGLVTLLEPPELQAVIRHEVAHHRLDHPRDLLLASVVTRAFGWLAPVRRSVASYRVALEESADDASAMATPEGAAELRAALVRLAASPAVTSGQAELEHRIRRIDEAEAEIARTPRGALVRGAAIGVAALLVTAIASELVALATTCLR